MIMACESGVCLIFLGRDLYKRYLHVYDYFVIGLQGTVRGFGEGNGPAHFQLEVETGQELDLRTWSELRYFQLAFLFRIGHIVAFIILLLTREVSSEKNRLSLNRVSIEFKQNRAVVVVQIWTRSCNVERVIPMSEVFCNYRNLRLL